MQNDIKSHLQPHRCASKIIDKYSRWIQLKSHSLIFSNTCNCQCVTYLVPPGENGQMKIWNTPSVSLKLTPLYLVILFTILTINAHSTRETAIHRIHFKSLNLDPLNQWLLFCGWYFQMHYLESRCLYFDSNSYEVGEGLKRSWCIFPGLHNCQLSNLTVFWSVTNLCIYYSAMMLNNMPWSAFNINIFLRCHWG